MDESKENIELVNNTIVVPFQIRKPVEGMFGCMIKTFDDGKKLGLITYKFTEPAEIFLVNQNDFERGRWLDLYYELNNTDIAYLNLINRYNCNINGKLFYILTKENEAFVSRLEEAVSILQDYTGRELIKRSNCRRDWLPDVLALESNATNDNYDYFYKDEYKSNGPKCDICSSSLIFKDNILNKDRLPDGSFISIEKHEKYIGVETSEGLWRNFGNSRHISSKELRWIRYGRRPNYKVKYKMLKTCSIECQKKAEKLIRDFVRKEVSQWLEKKRIEVCKKLLPKTRRAFRQNNPEALKLLKKEYELAQTSPKSCLH